MPFGESEEGIIRTWGGGEEGKAIQVLGSSKNKGPEAAHSW